MVGVAVRVELELELEQEQEQELERELGLELELVPSRAFPRVERRKCALGPWATLRIHVLAIQSVNHPSILQEF